MIQKAYKGPAMEGVVATWYARITRGDRGQAACAETIARAVPAGARILEVAPGPGYLAIELARRGSFQVSGLDISHSFVRIARENARAAGVRIDFQQGNASRMPYPDTSFDFVICRAAFKNFTDPLGALDEIHRVLVPGGRASIHDLRKEASLDDVDGEVEKMNLSPLSALWTRWTFRGFLLKNAYNEHALQQLVRKSKFGRGDVRQDGIGFELKLEKLRSNPQG